ncbi:MAG: PEGA domain-containing protein [Deltaproteobacteria bacterium]|nr:MAG: PEGA domain-containing protein [Deltaproteobacteria bacterium]
MASSRKEGASANEQPQRPAGGPAATAGKRPRKTERSRMERRREFGRRHGIGGLRVLITKPFGMGGTVLVDGKRRGQVPGPVIPVTEGKHTITVLADDGRRITKEVTVEAGKRRTLTVRFE